MDIDADKIAWLAYDAYDSIERGLIGSAKDNLREIAIMCGTPIDTRKLTKKSAEEQ